MIMMIEKMTKEQEAHLPIFRDEYLKIGLDTSRVDFEQAKADITALYEWGGLQPPKQFLFFTSPMICELYLNLIVKRSKLGGQLWDQLRGQLWDQLRDQLWDQLGGQLWGQLGDQKFDYMGTWFNGQQDAYWVSFYHFSEFIGAKFGKKTSNGLDAWKRITRSCHWFYPFNDFCLISDKPQSLSRDEQGRLHSLNSAALSYPDGWSIYAVHGVRVPEYVIMRPSAITVDKITNEQNAEIRRVMLDKFGWDRYLVESGAKAIHQDNYGTLYRAELPDDEPLVMVKVTNSTPEPDGSFKDYFLRVPPNITRADEAVAWTFGMTAKEYQPVMES